MSKKEEKNGAVRLASISDNLVHEQLSTFIDKITAHAILLIDSKRIIKSWNHGAEHIFGYTSTEAVGLSSDKLFPESSNVTPFKAAIKNAKKEESLTYERWACHKNGNPFWISIEITSISTKMEEEPVFGLSIYNLSKERQVEDNLRASQEKLRTILEAIPTPIFVKDTDLRYTDCNAAFEKYIGLTREQLIGPSLFELFEKSKAEVYEKADRELLQSKEPQIYETLARFNDGSDHTVIFRKNVYSDEQGHQQGIVGLIEDITERKGIEENLEKITKVYQLILDNSTLGIALVRNRSFVLANNRIGEMFTIPIEKIQGAPTRLIYPSDEVNKQIGDVAYPVLESGNRFETIIQTQRSDGTLFWCRFIGNAINPKDPNEGSIWMLEDITDRKRDEENLSRITKVYQLILDNSTLGIAFVRNRIFEWANNRLGELLLFPIDKLQGASTRSIYPSDEPYEQLGKEAYPLLEKGGSYETTLQLKRSDENLFWCRFIGKAINPSDPKEGSIWMFEDITERLQIEKALKHSRASLQALIENTDDSIWSIDNSYQITTFNSRFKHRVMDLLGQTVEIGSNINELPEPFQSTWKERLANVLQGARYSAVDRMTDNGNPAYIEERLHPIMVDDLITGVTCFSRDITQRILAEEALIKSQSQLTIAMELSMMCSWEYNVLPGRFLFDDQFYAIYAGSVKEQMGYLTISEFLNRFVYPEDWPMIDDIMKTNLASNANALNQFEHRIVRSDGELRHVVVRFTSIKDQEGNITKFIGAIQDVTDRKKIEIKLKELNASKDKFFSIIAHDLKNPFNSLIGLSELLKAKVIENNYTELNFFSESIYSVSKQTYTLLENLLEWANSQQGGMKYNPRVINLQNQTNEVVELLMEVANRKSITISVDINDGITILADPDMLNTILRNLVSNAIKFTFKNGKINLAATVSNSWATISVSDNGTGMSPETVDKIFALASNVSTPGTNKEKGTGLGLLLCKDFVEKHGGTIWAESEEGKGSAFRFTLPLTDPM